MDKKYPWKKGISGAQNVLGWEIFYYCSWRKFSVFHSDWQHDSALCDNTTWSCTSAPDPYGQHVSLKHWLPVDFQFNLQCLTHFYWRCLHSLLTCGRNAGKLDHGLLQITILTCITRMWDDDKSIVMKTSRPSNGTGYCWIACQSGLLLS
jgi:hypothetical protein